MSPEMDLSEIKSRLEESYRDPETGHFILSPEEAKDILFKPVLDFYEARAAWPCSSDLMVQVLIRIAKAEGERYDFTKILEDFKDKQAEAERQRLEEDRVAGIPINTIYPSAPRVPEI